MFITGDEPHYPFLVAQEKIFRVTTIHIGRPQCLTVEDSEHGRMVTGRGCKALFRKEVQHSFWISWGRPVFQLTNWHIHFSVGQSIEPAI